MPDRFNPPDQKRVVRQVEDRSGHLTASELRHLAINNGYKTWQPSVRSTALRSHELSYRTLGQGPSQRLAEEYLVASRLVRGDARVQLSTRPYFNDYGLRAVSMIGWEEPHPEDVITLPDPHPIEATVGAAVKKRRSRRDFTGEQLSIQELADILGHSAGRTGSAHVELAEGGEVELPLYATANGGGLRPVEVYVMPLNVQDTEPVVHRYDRRRRVLVKDPGAVAAAEVIDTCISPPDQKHMSLASAVFLLTARPWRSMRKYRARGLRFSFLEAGSVAAAIALAATALELGAVECGSLCDNEVHSLLKIDGIFETYVHSIIVGRR